MAIGTGWLAVLAVTSTLGIGAMAAPALMGANGMGTNGDMMGNGGMGGGMMGNGMHGGSGHMQGMHGDHGGMCGDHGAMGDMMGDHQHEHMEDCDHEMRQQHSMECETHQWRHCCEADGGEETEAD